MERDKQFQKKIILSISDKYPSKGSAVSAEILDSSFTPYTDF